MCHTRMHKVCATGALYLYLRVSCRIRQNPSDFQHFTSFYTFLHHVITMFHFSDEVEVDEAKSCGFIGFLRNTGPMQNKVLRW